MSFKFTLPTCVGFQLPDDIIRKSRLYGTINTSGGGARGVVLFDRRTMTVIGSCMMKSDYSWEVYAQEPDEVDQILAVYLDHSGNFNASVVDRWDLCEVTYSPDTNWDSGFVYTDRAKFLKVYTQFGYIGEWITRFTESIQDVKGTVAQLQIDTFNASGHFETSGGTPVINSNVVDGSLFNFGEITNITSPGTNDDDIALESLDKHGFLETKDILGDGSCEIYHPLMYTENVDTSMTSTYGHIEWQDNSYFGVGLVPLFNDDSSRRGSVINTDWFFPLSAGQELTFSALVNVDTAAGSPEDGVLFFVTQSIFISIYNHYVTFTRNTSTSSAIWSAWHQFSTLATADGVWKHIIVSLSATNARLWINGAIADTDAGDYSIDPYTGDDPTYRPRTSFFGSSINGNYYGTFGGNLQQVRVFNRALTGDAEALSIYNNDTGTTAGQVYPVTAINNITSGDYSPVYGALSQYNTIAFDNDQVAFGPLLGNAPDTFSASVTIPADYHTYTIDSSLIDATLSNYPVGIKIESSTGLLDGLREDDWQYLHATVSSVECYMEVAYWNITTGEAVLWVKVGSISDTTDTDIRISIGTLNTSYVGLSGSAVAQNVWDANYVGVYHMAQDPSGGTDSILDSSASANHLTPSGSMDSNDLVDQGFGYALDFDGSDDYLESKNNIGISGSAARTIEIQLLGDIANRAITGWGVDGSTTRYGMQIESTSTNGYRIDINSGNRIWPTDLTLSEKVIGITMPTSGSCNDLTAYASGSAETPSSTSDNTINTTDSHVWIGKDPSSLSNFSGWISEVRYSDIERTAAWEKATYHVLNNSLLTYSVGPDSTTSKMYPSFSFDNKQTYSVWDGVSAWRPIASMDDTIHGNTGDSDWYYRDNASVWSKSGVSNRLEAISAAVDGNANNQNDYSVVNAITNTEWEGTNGFDDTVGRFDFALTFYKSTIPGCIINNISIDDKKYWYSPVIDLDEITDTIDWSRVSWGYGRSLTMSDADFNEFKDNLKVYVVRTGDTSWAECTNGSTIPGVANGYTTSGIQIQFRIEHDTITSAYEITDFMSELYVEIN